MSDDFEEANDRAEQHSEKICHLMGYRIHGMLTARWRG